MRIRIKQDKQIYQYNLNFPSSDDESYRVKIDFNNNDLYIRYENYDERIWDAKQDFTDKVDKVLELVPKSLMGGILGYTHLFSGKMARRDDLTGDTSFMVDVHEAIHTPDEYETRILTDWMIKKERPRYKF